MCTVYRTLLLNVEAHPLLQIKSHNGRWNSRALTRVRFTATIVLMLPENVPVLKGGEGRGR